MHQPFAFFHVHRVPTWNDVVVFKSDQPTINHFIWNPRCCCIESDPIVWEHSRDVIRNTGAHYYSNNVFITYLENLPLNRHWQRTTLHAVVVVFYRETKPWQFSRNFCYLCSNPHEIVFYWRSKNVFCSFEWNDTLMEMFPQVLNRTVKASLHLFTINQKTYPQFTALISKRWNRGRGRESSKIIRVFTWWSSRISYYLHTVYSKSLLHKKQCRTLLTAVN